MGGRSSSSGIVTSRAVAEGAARLDAQLRAGDITIEQRNAALAALNGAREYGDTLNSDRQVERQIRSAKFTDEGFGDWQMDIERVGGGQVLDEKGSSRALRAGFMPNNSAYSANAWIYDETGQPRMADLGFFNTRREAQNAIKDHILDQRVRRR